MEAVKAGTAYELVDPHTGKVGGRKRDARKVFQLIVESAWAVGDPGLIFIDRVNRANPTAGPGAHPGHQPLRRAAPPRLRVLQPRLDQPGQLPRAARARTASTGSGSPASIRLGVRFLDDVIEVNRYPLPQIEAMTQGNRRIGLGVMGWADLLLLMKIRYDSAKALALAEKVAAFLRKEAVAASRGAGRRARELPQHRQIRLQGHEDAERDGLHHRPDRDDLADRRLLVARSSPSSPSRSRLKIIDSEIKDVHPIYEEWKEKNPGRAPARLFRHGPRDLARVAHPDAGGLPEARRQLGLEDDQLPPRGDGRGRRARPTALAYDLGTKGITIYRDGCRDEQVLYKERPRVGPIPQDRPVTLPSVTDKIKTGFGNLYVTISFYNQKPFEVFASIGKSGYSTMADAEALGRLISLALRSGVDAKEVIQPAQGDRRRRSPSSPRAALVQSIPDAIAKVLERHVGEKCRASPRTSTRQPAGSAARPSPTKSARSARTAAGASAPEPGQPGGAAWLAGGYALGPWAVSFDKLFK